MEANEKSHALRRTPVIVAAVMLILALTELPLGYYHLLRLIVCGVSVYVVVVAYYRAKDWACWTFGFIAVLFNPLHPVSLPRDMWMPIDVVCAVLFAVAIFVLRKPAVY
jgi:hypothetical protein